MAGNNGIGKNLKFFLPQRGYHCKKIKENGEGFYVQPAKPKPKHIKEGGKFL